MKKAKITYCLILTAFILLTVKPCFSQELELAEEEETSAYLTEEENPIQDNEIIDGSSDDQDILAFSEDLDFTILSEDSSPMELSEDPVSTVISENDELYTLVSELSTEEDLYSSEETLFVLEEDTDDQSEVIIDVPEITLEDAVSESGLARNAKVNQSGMFPGKLRKKSASFNQCYGQQLGGETTLLYNVFCDNWGNGGINQITYTFSEAVTFEAQGTITNGVWTWAGKEADQNFQNVYLNTIGRYTQGAFDAFVYDYPEVFWINSLQFSYGISFSVSDDTVTGRISALTLFGKERWEGALGETGLFQSKVDNAEGTVAERLNAGMSQAQKLKVIHDYVCEITDYAESAQSHCAYGVFVNGVAVCEGYAKAIKILCDRFGIPCVLGPGEAKLGGSATEAHMWNYIQIDGRWYMVDATWDDQETIRNTYLLAGSSSEGFVSVISSERVCSTYFSDSPTATAFIQPVIDSEMYHEAGEWIIDVEATDLENGSKHSECVLCGITLENEMIPARSIWKQSPVLSVSGINGRTIELSWVQEYPATHFSVYEIQNGKYVYLKMTDKNFISLDSQGDGIHDYCVRPRQKNDSGTWVFGRYSNIVQAEPDVNAYWYTAPVFTSALQTDDGRVSLTWESELPADAYSVYELINGKKEYIAKTNSLTYIIKNVLEGEHVYYVRPRRLNDDGAWEFGEYSKPVTVEIVREVWKDAPYSLSVKRIGTDVVQLQWEVTEEAEAYSVYEIINNAPVFIKMSTSKTLKITGVNEGEHVYCVRPRKKNSAGTWVFGNYSEYLIMEMDDGVWMRSPVLTAAVSGEDKVTLSWTVSSEAQAYSVYEYVSGKYQYVRMIYGNSAVLSGVANGDHTYAVRPRKLEYGTWVFGEYSNKVAISM